MYVLYRWFRVHFAAGMMRSSISVIHQKISTAYDQAKKLLLLTCKNESEGQLQEVLELRNHIAGLWCVYAQIVIELGQEALKAAHAEEMKHAPRQQVEQQSVHRHTIVLQCGFESSRTSWS